MLFELGTGRMDSVGEEGEYGVVERGHDKDIVSTSLWIGLIYGLGAGWIALFLIAVTNI